MHKDTTVTVREQSSLPEGVYEVTVHEKSITVHTVTLSEEYYQQLTGGTMSPEALIERSFAFLLEREPNTAILRTFDLKDITRYFSEYEAHIKEA